MAQKSVLVTIARDYWDENDVRHRKGEEFSVAMEVALRGVASGALILKEIVADEPKKRGRKGEAPTETSDPADETDEGA